LSKTDENIKNTLKEKFASHESTVNPEIWNSISKGLSSASTSTATSFSIAKIIGIAATVVVAALTTIIVLNSSNQDEKIGTKTSSETSTKTETSDITINSKKTAKKDVEDSSISSQKVISSNSSLPLLESPINPSHNEDLKDGKWQDLDDKIVGIRDGEGTGQNSSDERNKLNNIYNDTEEPISASFHTRIVDAGAMRYFFFPKTSANATFKWTSSDGYSSSDITFSHQFNEEGNYTIELTATDKSGNIATESITVQVVKPIAFKIPNAFSPGINGRNDVINFEESTQNEGSINSVTIIDRNGTVIYESNNDFIWNGSNKSGELAPAGVYTYIITAIDKLGESRMNKGTIQLFRE
jgi:gliding motility-associated-like protein